MVDLQKCFLANLRSEIREFHDLQTQRNRRRNITGSQHRISEMRSNGRVGRGCAFREGGCDVRVRVFSVVTIVDEIINQDMSVAVA